MCDVFRESCEFILSKKGFGNLVVIVVGGVEEVFDVYFGNYLIILKFRKGFVKLVLRIG